jgi:hypothetical protein
MWRRRSGPAAEALRTDAAESEPAAAWEARLKAVQAEGVRSDEDVLRAAAAGDLSTVAALDALRRAIDEAYDEGVCTDVIDEAERALRHARARLDEEALRVALASSIEVKLCAALRAVKKERRGTIDKALLAECERALAAMRRQTAARNSLRQAAEMAGPSALARAIEVARRDGHTPDAAIADAEQMLRQRAREERVLRWLRVLREAREAQARDAQREEWEAQVRSGALTQEVLLAAVHALDDEVRAKMGRPRANPPAWLHFCREALSVAVARSRRAREDEGVGAAGGRVEADALRAAGVDGGGAHLPPGQELVIWERVERGGGGAHQAGPAAVQRAPGCHRVGRLGEDRELCRVASGERRLAFKGCVHPLPLKGRRRPSHSLFRR